MPEVDRAVVEVTLPLRHDDIIRQQARDKGLDPALIAAVIYAESRFTDATSPAGARGLMQITPDTARVIARRSGGVAFEQGDLSTPQINIAYGSFHLRWLIDRFDGEIRSPSPPTTRGRATSTGGSRRAAPRATRSRSPRRAPTWRRSSTRAGTTARAPPPVGPLTRVSSLLGPRKAIEETPAPTEVQSHELRWELYSAYSRRASLLAGRDG
jgi:soluble lytic murein transglycosylase-like protein